jgi:hypothetical protein
MHTIKYRLTEPRLTPRRTKIEIPGWAGNPSPRVEGSQEYPWHCIPFTEAARYGIEIIYPYETAATVRFVDKEFQFDGFDTDPNDGRAWPPFRSFGKEYYTFQLMLDLKVEKGMAVKIETHPRFYTDTTGTVPIAVPAIIREWWPMIFFLVFKTPPEGSTHIFRPGEPFVQFTVIPEEPDFNIIRMPESEAAEREIISRRIYQSRSTIGKDSTWLSATQTVFDATYRRLAGAARKLVSHQ